MKNNVSKENFKEVINKLIKITGDRAPTILTVVAVAGVIGSIVLAVKGTKKADKIIEENKDTIDSAPSEASRRFEELRHTWKCYMPAVAAGVVTVACAISANSINLKRNAALVAALAAASSDKMRDLPIVKDNVKRVKDVINGEVKDKVVSDKSKLSTMDPEKIYYCRDELSGRLFKTSINEIQNVEKGILQDLLYESKRTVNDMYRSFADTTLDELSIGENYWWDPREGDIIDIDIGADLDETHGLILTINYSDSLNDNCATAIHC